jgi:3-isopropylmalate/(R)-2-methylmalate dehydratase small subunit
MTPFQTLTGLVALILTESIDTDVIIPVQEMLKVPRAQLGKHAFRAMRYDANESTLASFPFQPNDPNPPTILIVGRNFGCGSSREPAVYAIQGLGVRALIGTSYGDIFLANCVKNGILPACLKPDAFDRLVTDMQRLPIESRSLHIDLNSQLITTSKGVSESFTIAPAYKKQLLKGHDELSMTTTYEELIKEFRKVDAQRRPWMSSSETYLR